MNDLAYLIDLVEEQNFMLKDIQEALVFLCQQYIEEDEND